MAYIESFGEIHITTLHPVFPVDNGLFTLPDTAFRTQSSLVQIQSPRLTRAVVCDGQRLLFIALRGTYVECPGVYPSLPVSRGIVRK